MDMEKILVPFDGSENALRAVEHAAAQAAKHPETQVLLLHVVDPYSVQPNSEYWKATDKSRFLNEGEKVLVPAKQVLDKTGVATTVAVTLGSPGHEIAAFAKENACHSIVMGTRGLGAVASFFVGSIAQRVLQLADVPVTLVK